MEKKQSNFIAGIFIISVVIFVVFQVFTYKYDNRISSVGSNLMSIFGSAKGGNLKRVYYPNGKLEAEISYKDGKHHGITKTYYEDGSLFSEENYVNGKREGLSKSYFPVGNIMYERIYENDKAISLIEYNEKGQVIFENKQAQTLF